jgi:hypothetical protein
MIHPDTRIRFINDEIGVGVFATRLIRRGTIVWIQDELDMELSREYVMSLEPLRREIIIKYAYVGAGGKYILCWDHGRYVNHCFCPNMAATAYGFELAARDILPGEELRCDYATFGSDGSFECAPERGTLRTRVMPDDYLYSHRYWDEAAREAFKCFNLVDQPLRYLIRPEFVDKVSTIAAGQAALDSFLTVYAQK